MVKKKSRGPISKAIRNLCSSTLLDHINEPKFRDGLIESVDEYQTYLRQIGMVIQTWIIEYTPDRKDEIWRLVDEVEPKIRQQYEKWANSYFKEG